MRVLVTGASGFVGQALLPALARSGLKPRAAVRRSETQGDADESVLVRDIGPETDWRSALCGMDTVVHLAARVHVMREETVNPLMAFRETNTAGTLNLANQAVVAGVRRFVFVSSIKVNGEGRDAPYSESDAPEPLDAYAISKWEAEQGLREIERETGLEVVIIRPPLVYGPGVKANFLSLMRAVHAGWPLPLGAVKNRRSLLYLGNFVDAISLCLVHPAAAGQTFVLADGTPLSSAELVRKLARALGCTPHLLPVPANLLRLVASLVGRADAADRLLGSLVVDDQLIRERLGWRPPVDAETGLFETARAYLAMLGGGRSDG